MCLALPVPLSNVDPFPCHDSFLTSCARHHNPLAPLQPLAAPPPSFPAPSPPYILIVASSTALPATFSLALLLACGILSWIHNRQRHDLTCRCKAYFLKASKKKRGTDARVAEGKLQGRAGSTSTAITTRLGDRPTRVVACAHACAAGQQSNRCVQLLRRCLRGCSGAARLRVTLRPSC